jgi:hypothetical protein
MGQINSLPSIILPTHKPFEVKPKKDSTKQQKESPHEQEQDAEQKNRPDDQSPHVDVKA